MTINNANRATCSLKFYFGGRFMKRGIIKPVDLITRSNIDLVEALQEEVLEDIPTGIKSAGDLERIEYLLGKLANDYSYVISLLCIARSNVRQFKRTGDKVAYEDMMDKRDSLESIASAIKLQHGAVSRMLTALMQNEERLNEFRLGGKQ